MEIKQDLLMSNESFSKYLGRSFFFHVVIVMLVILIPIILMKFNFGNSQKNIILAKSSVKVDLVEMPKLTVKELKNLDLSVGRSGEKDSFDSTEAEIKEAAIKEKEAFLKKKKKKSFLDIVKNYEKKAVPKKKVKAKNNSKLKPGNKNNIDGTKLNELLYMGNKLSKGTAITGSHSDAEITVLESYASLLPNHVKPYWKLPSYLMKEDLQCRIQVFLSAMGKVVNLKVHTSSGEAEYDQKAMDAIKAAEPFPQVPDTIKALVLRGQILLGFPL